MAPPLPGDAAINYLDRLGLPALGVALKQGALAGLAIPGLVVGGVILAAALPIFKRTIQGIRDEKRLTVDFLDASAVVLLTAQASFLAPAIVIGIIEGSEIVRDWTARRSKQATLDLLLTQQRQVTVERDGRQLLLAWDEIETGDVLLLYPGDQIPVDGFVLAGQALVDQHHMTGNATPVTCTEGDVVHATTLLVEGQSAHPGHTHRPRHPCGCDPGAAGCGAPHGYAGQQLCAQGGQRGRRAHACDRGRRVGHFGQPGADDRYPQPGLGHRHPRVRADCHSQGADGCSATRHPDPQRPGS